MLRNKIQGLEATDPDFPQLSLAERRKKLRIRTYIRLDVTVGSTTSSAIVTDLSLDGMRLRTNFELKDGDSIEVSFPEESAEASTQAVKCATVWVTSFGPPGRTTYEAGLSFQDSPDNMKNSWVRYVLEQLGFDQTITFQKRKYLRTGGRVPARVFTMNADETITGEIVNLGIGGALLSSQTPIDNGSLIHCEICLWRILPALRLPCKVLSVRQDSVETDGPAQHLHSLLFLGMDMEQVKLLGNYVIYLINQSE